MATAAQDARATTTATTTDATPFAAGKGPYVGPAIAPYDDAELGDALPWATEGLTVASTEALKLGAQEDAGVRFMVFLRADVGMAKCWLARAEAKLTVALKDEKRVSDNTARAYAELEATNPEAYHASVRKECGDGVQTAEYELAEEDRASFNACVAEFTEKIRALALEMDNASARVGEAQEEKKYREEMLVEAKFGLRSFLA